MDELNTIRVPRALPGLEPLMLDMAEIRMAERRLNEVAMTNAARAGELMQTFNKGWLDVTKYLNWIENEADVVDRQNEECKAVFLIDKLPDLLAAKGLASSRSPLGSEDIRMAFLNQDADYKAIQEKVMIFNAYIRLFKTLQTAFENGYNSVKKLLGNDSSSWRPNSNLIQPAPTNTAAVPAEASGDFWGRPT